MNLGQIVRKAVSAFAGSKSRSRPARPTRSTPSSNSQGSAKSDLARGAVKMAKKKL